MNGPRSHPCLVRRLGAVSLSATPFTAALAGAFSAVAWTFLSPLLTDPRPAATAWLMAGVLALFAVPLHLFVVGIGHGRSFGQRASEPGFRRRLLCWLVAAVAVTVLAGVSRPPATV